MSTNLDLLNQVIFFIFTANVVYFNINIFPFEDWP